jgi:hypothetical protein
MATQQQLIDRLLDQVEGVVETLELEKRSRPSTNNPLDDALMSSAYDAPVNDLDDEDLDDSDDSDDEAPGYDGEDWDGDTDDSDGSEDDEAERRGATHTTVPIQRGQAGRDVMLKYYGQVDSSTMHSETPPLRHHRFESKIRNIMARDKVQPAEAARRARVENPVLFADYQRSGLQGHASHQALVTAEMRKGFSRTVAEQRIMHLYGNTAGPTLTKGDTVTTRFMRCVDTVMKRHPGMSRMEAMQAARERNPRLFARFQNV